MNGFIITHQFRGDQLPTEYSWKPLFDFQPPHIVKTIRSSILFAEQFTPVQFEHHKFFIEEDDFIFISEGIITNITRLLSRYNCDYPPELFRKMYQQDKEFFRQFNGTFAGYFYDKNTAEILVFNNHTGTRKLYYYKDSRYLVVSTDLKVIATTLKQLAVIVTPDQLAMTMILSYGFMLEDHTYLNEVKQVVAGQYLKADSEFLVKKFYFHLSEISIQEKSVPELIIQLEKCFNAAVSEEYSIDEEYGYQSFATMSGGLDSRMTVLAAQKLGFQQQLIGFSQKGYADEVIAIQIARDKNLPINQIELTAESLTAIDAIIRVNDGMSVYSGAGHVFQALGNVNYLNRGILHTGMLGDAIMGSYLKSPCDTAPEVSAGAHSQQTVAKYAGYFSAIVSKYPTEELFKFYNRAFQGINNGFLLFNLFSETLSPFLHPDFIRLALSIPKKMAFKERLYIEWIRRLHPDRAKYCWENTGGKPTNNQFLLHYYRYRRAIIKRLPIKTMWKNRMTPEQVWYDTSTDIQQALNIYLEQHLENRLLSAEQKKVYREQYFHGGIAEKAQVLTVLGALKHLFE